jgi:hydrogenase nickel incorporation protein HypA/HybF
MHEFSLIEAVIDSIEERSREGSWGRITKVTLKIGEMRQVIPEILQFSFSVASKGSSMEGAELVIIELALEKRCRSCGNSWKGSASRCTSCGCDDTETVSGMELEIESVEVEE